MIRTLVTGAAPDPNKADTCGSGRSSCLTFRLCCDDETRVGSLSLAGFITTTTTKPGDEINV